MSPTGRHTFNASCDFFDREQRLWNSGDRDPIQSGSRLMLERCIRLRARTWPPCTTTECDEAKTLGRRDGQTDDLFALQSAHQSGNLIPRQRFATELQPKHAA